VPARSQREDHEAWAAHAARVGHCHRPVKLVGQAHTIDRATGVILSTLDSDVLPDGVLYVKCGNRRASACQPCSREYGADMWHLLRAGAAGGDKGVPTSVVTHPMVFATLTAPSFGPVHSAKRPGSTTRRCRPRSRGERCPTGSTSAAWPCTRPASQTSGSRCASSATTMKHTSSGSGGPPSCGAGSPSPCPGSSPSSCTSPRSKPVAWCGSPSPRLGSTNSAASSTSRHHSPRRAGRG